jgi:hypothetical protein
MVGVLQAVGGGTHGMDKAIGQSLPLAIGVALSPVSIIAVVLLLTSSRARSFGPVFVLGWLLGLVVVGAIVGALCPAVLDLLAKQPKRHAERADRCESGREIAKVNRHDAHARRLAGSRSASQRWRASTPGRA